VDSYEHQGDELILWAELPAESEVSALLTTAIRDLSSNSMQPYQFEFQTGPEDPPSGPVVIHQYPEDGAVHIPVLSPIELAFDKELDPSSLGAGMVVHESGQPVTGQIQHIIEGRGIRFIADEPLSPTATIDVFVTEELMDLGGLPAQPSHFEFTTAAESGGDALILQEFYPSTHEGYVNQRIEARFNVALEPFSVTAESVRLEHAGGAVPVEVSLVAGGRVLSIMPSVSLELDQYYQVILTDLVGVNGQVASWSESFRARYEADNEHPALQASSPSPELASVPINAPAQFAFSEALSHVRLFPEAVSVTVSGQDYEHFWLDYPSYANLVSIKPNFLWPENARVEIALSELTDKAGNVLPPLTLAFDTNALLDLERPVVVDFVPASGSLIAPDAPIVLTCSEPINRARLQGGTGFEREWIDGDQAVRFIPGSPLVVGQSYSINLTVRDLVGNSVNAHTSFSVQDTDYEPPEIIGQYPAQGEMDFPLTGAFSFVFDEPVIHQNPAAILMESGNEVAIEIWQSRPESLRAKPVHPLQAHTDYELRLQGVRDGYGNLMPAVTIPFRTGSQAWLGPKIVSTTMDESQPQNAVFYLFFNHPLDPNAMSGDRFRLIYDYEDRECQVDFLDEHTVRVDPVEPLPLGYGLRFRLEDVHSVNGAPYNLTRYLSVRPEFDEESPVVLAVVPEGGSTDIPSNTLIRILFSEAVVPFGQAQAGLWLSVDGRPIEADVSPSWRSDLWAIRPEEDLPRGVPITVNVVEFVDLADHRVPGFSWSFELAPSAGVDDQRPSLVQSNPAHGSGSVPLDQSIQWVFDESIDGTSVGYVAVLVGDPATPLEWDGNIAVSQETLTFDPAQPFPPNTSVTMRGYIRDLAGNSSGLILTTVSTGTGSTLPPFELLASTPASGAVDVFVELDVSLQFNNPVASTAEQIQDLIGVLVGSQHLPFNVYLASDRRSIVLVVDMPPDAMVSVVIGTGIEDVYGQVLAPVTIEFQTGSPSPLFADVVDVRHLNGEIALHLSHPAQALSFESAFRVTFYTGAPIAGQLDFLNDYRVVVFRPDQPLPLETSVRVLLDDTALAVDGRHFREFQGSVATDMDPSTSAPEATYSFEEDEDVPPNVRIRLLFNEPIDPLSVGSDTVDLLPGDIPIQIELTNGDRTLTASPLTALTPGIYSLRTDVTDFDGDSYYESYRFNVVGEPDLSPPVALATSPAGGMSDVPINSEIQMMFDETIDRVSFEEIELRDSGGELVPFNFESQGYYHPHRLKPFPALASNSIS